MAGRPTFAPVMHIILIGMPGAGKTHLGRRLAIQTGRIFTDTDHEVEKRAGTSIAALIEAEGEPAFRSLEAEVLEDALADAPQIIATGGGAPMLPGAMDKLLAAGTVVYLHVDEAVAVERIRNDSAARLHLAGDVAGKWAALFAQRADTYRRAHILCRDVEALLRMLKVKC